MTERQHALSKELINAIQADATIVYNLWKAESTEEQRAKGLEYKKKMRKN